MTKHIDKLLFMQVLGWTLYGHTWRSIQRARLQSLMTSVSCAQHTFLDPALLPGWALWIDSPWKPQSTSFALCWWSKLSGHNRFVLTCVSWASSDDWAEVSWLSCVMQVKRMTPAWNKFSVVMRISYMCAFVTTCMWCWLMVPSHLQMHLSGHSIAAA